MITCPWCGTHYTAFQPNCDNCGGTLPLPTAAVPRMDDQAGAPAAEAAAEVAMPPAPPRQVPRNYHNRLVWTDAWFIVGFVFTLLGSIFSLVGCATLPMVMFVAPLFVGIPFALIGIPMLATGIWLMVTRVKAADKTVELLANGLAVQGQIVEVTQNFHVRVNHRYPWTIRYSYQVGGSPYQGQVSTFSMPGMAYQPNTLVPVLYAADEPSASTLYPNALGYFG